MTRLRNLIVILAATIIPHAAIAELSVASLNCFLLFSPDNNQPSGIRREPTPPDVYTSKLENLSRMIIESGAEFVALQEVGSKAEVEDLADTLERATGAQWRVCFVQGKDTFTGQDVAALVRSRAGLRVVNFRRASQLEKHLSKHLVVTVEADGDRISVCVVHLIRPIRNDAIEKHRRQLEALTQWVDDVDAVVVVAGDYNSANRDLLQLHSADLLTSFAPTHISGKAFDHIYSSRAFASAAVFRPPYGRKPNKQNLATWTDHFLVRAVIP